MRSIRPYCTGCGREYPLGTKRYSCGQGVLQVILTKPHIKGALPISNAPGIWCYEAFLLSISTKVSMHEGGAPLILSMCLGQKLSVDLLYKDETRNPTGSFKDRTAAIMISAAKDPGTQEIVTASGGNATVAISLYSMLAGINAFIFIFHPSQQKLLQTLSYGATGLVVETTSEARVLQLAEQAADAFGWASPNTTAAANTSVAKGYKTVSYELYEQGNVPYWIAIPVASGSLPISIWQGFRKLGGVGLAKRLPWLLGAQPAGAAPITLAFEAQEKAVKPIKQASTIATALSLEDPGASGTETIRAVREGDGTTLTVEDKELIDVSRGLPRQDGIYGEASDVISVAGFIQARRRGMINHIEYVICIISGGGLKDPAVFLEKGPLNHSLYQVT